MRPFIASILKLSIGFAVVFFLWYNGSVDFRRLAILWQRPELFLIWAFVWITSIVSLSALRWRILLVGSGINMPIVEILRAHLVGMFFNSTIPGAVGGDVVKAYYASRYASNRKTMAILTIIADRAVGLATLLFLALTCVLTDVRYFFGELPEISWTIVFFNAAVFFFFAIRSRIKFGAGESKLAKTIDAVVSFPIAKLLHAGLITIAVQIPIVFFLYRIAAALNGFEPSPAPFFAAYTIGAVASAIPIAPAGIGVGHMAFERLFAAVGVSEGANVFNIYVISQIVFNFTGFIAYLRRPQSPP